MWDRAAGIGCRAAGAHARALAALLIALATIAMAAAVSGCKDSDTLFEINYTQDASEVDENTEDFVWVYDPTSDYITDQLPESVIDSVDASYTQEMPRALYSSSAGTEYTASQFYYNDPADYSCEPTGAISYQQALDKQDKGTAENIAQDATQQSEDLGSGGDGDSSSTGPGDTLSQDSQYGNDGGTGVGANSGGDAQTYDNGTKDEGPKQGDNPSGPGTPTPASPTVHDAQGDYSDIPMVNKVAAYGAAAVAVQMLGGSGVLVAADAKTLSSGFSTVFADEGAASIATAWSGDGSDASQLDVDALIAAKPDTVLVYSNDYISDAGVSAKLAAANISVTVIPKFSSDSSTKRAIGVIAAMISSSTTKSVADPKGLAEQYVSWHDSLVDKILSSNGGYSTLDGIICDDGIESIQLSSRDMYTLVIDDWDYSAVYNGTFMGQNPATAYDGVGLATTGYHASPVSYYLGIGGVVNNSAVEPSFDAARLSKKAVVWQFNLGQLDPNAGNWTYDSTASPLRNTALLQTSLFDEALLKVAKSSNGLGSSEFPAVIVRTAAMRDAMVADSEQENGIYHAYPYSTSSDGSSSVAIEFIGKMVDSQPLYSKIGEQWSSDGSTLSSALAGSDLGNCVLVNPCGMCSSWMDGSPESVLEAAWADDQAVFSGSNAVDVSQATSEFYAEFYRYELSDAELADILDGE